MQVDFYQLQLRRMQPDLIGFVFNVGTNSPDNIFDSRDGCGQ